MIIQPWRVWQIFFKWIWCPLWTFWKYFTNNLRLIIWLDSWVSRVFNIGHRLLGFLKSVVVFLLFCFGILLLGIGRLRKANQTFFLFSKINQDHIKFYRVHFDLINENVVKYSEPDSEMGFFKIFNILETNNKLINEIESRKHKSYKTENQSTSWIWSIKFLALISFAVVAVIVKYLTLHSLMSNTFNYFEFNKNICLYQIHLTATLQSISYQTYLQSISTVNNNTILNNTVLFNNLLARYIGSGETFDSAILMLQNWSSDLNFVGSLSGSGCDLISNITDYCDKPLVRSLMRNGLWGNIAYFNIAIRNSGQYFNRNNSLALSTDTFIPSLSFNSLINSFYMIFPFVK